MVILDFKEVLKKKEDQKKMIATFVKYNNAETFPKIIEEIQNFFAYQDKEMFETLEEAEILISDLLNKIVKSEIPEEALQYYLGGIIVRNIMVLKERELKDNSSKLLTEKDLEEILQTEILNENKEFKSC